LKIQTLDLIAKTKSYKKLVELFPPRIIESESAYNNNLKIVEHLLKVKSLSKDQTNYLDLLADLIESYEEKEFKIEPPPLPELISYLIENKGTLTQVAKESGVSKSLLSSVRSGKRNLGRKSMKKLAAYFKVDVSIFVEASVKLPEKSRILEAENILGGCLQVKN